MLILSYLHSALTNVPQTLLLCSFSGHQRQKFEKSANLAGLERGRHGVDTEQLLHLPGPEDVCFCALPPPYPSPVVSQQKVCNVHMVDTIYSRRHFFNLPKATYMEVKQSVPGGLLQLCTEQGSVGTEVSFLFPPGAHTCTVCDQMLTGTHPCSKSHTLQHHYSPGFFFSLCFQLTWQ